MRRKTKIERLVNHYERMRRRMTLPYKRLLRTEERDGALIEVWKVSRWPHPYTEEVVKES